MSVKKFSDMLKRIHTNKVTGTLTLVFNKGNRYLYIKDGEIKYLKSDCAQEKLGSILVSEKLITEEELTEAIEQSKQLGLVLGKFLLEINKITHEQLRQSLKKLFELILEACFLEEMIDINFVEKDILIDESLYLDVKTGNLVLETFRNIDHPDFEAFYEEHKNQKPKISQNNAFDYTELSLNPLEGFILSRIDGKLTFEEIKKIAFTDDKTFYKTIFALDFLGLVDYNETPPNTQKTEKNNKKETTSKQKVKTESKQAKTEDAEQPLTEEDKKFMKEVNELYLELPTINYYDLLIVDYKFDKNELKESYHKLIKKYHPDSHPKLKEIHHELHAIVSAITKAYNTLKNDLEREEYNKRMHINPNQNNTEKIQTQKLKKDKEKENDPKEELKAKIEQYVKAGLYYEAISLLESACKMYKDEKYFCKTLGNIYFKTPTKLKNAIHYLEKAHTLDRKDTEVIKNLARAYKKVGFYKEAYIYYKKLQHFDPDNTEAKKFLDEVEKKPSIINKLKNMFSGE